MIERKLLRNINTQLWPNILHMGLMNECMRRLNLEWSSANPCPELLQPYLSALEAAQARESDDYGIMQKSSLTALIAKGDAERDELLRTLKRMVETMARLSAMPVKQRAALVMKPTLDQFRLSAKQALREQTTQLSKWHEVFSASAEQVAAAEELGLTPIIASMMEKNHEVEALLAARTSEYGHKAEVLLAADRAASDVALREFTLMLNAHVLLDPDGTRFEELILGMNGMMNGFEQNFADHKRVNRRVKIVSSIVGNHTYAVSRGWTWATFAEHNPRALALDPTPSAPGVEPVVGAVRIVSVSRRARKAGGLCVALNGRAVSPADRVDVLQTYELLPIAEAEEDRVMMSASAQHLPHPSVVADDDVQTALQALPDYAGGRVDGGAPGAADGDGVDGRGSTAVDAALQE